MSASWPDIGYPGMARDLCRLTSLYAGRRQVPAGADAVGQSFLARDAVRQRARTDHRADPGRAGKHRDPVRPRRARDYRHGERWPHGGFPLGPMSVAEFHARFVEMIGWLGGTPKFDGRPNEVPDPVPFRDDRQTRPYDADAVARFYRALVAIEPIFQHFRTAFIGKVSPVHLFWGSFDLAVTRFSGRRAPLHPGGIPALPDAVTREAYSHEVSSAGFWPGGGGTDFAAFYSYAYPAPNGFADAPPGPAGRVFRSRAWRVPVALRRRAQIGRSGSDAAGVSRKHVPGRRRSRRLGLRRARMSDGRAVAASPSVALLDGPSDAEPPCVGAAM